MTSHAHIPDQTSDGALGLPSETLPPRAPKLRQPPFVFIAVGLVLIVASWLPLVLFARSRASVGPHPRVQFLQDMGTQPKYREQQSSEIFADGRADRPHVDGTVGRGKLWDDDARYRGFTVKADASGKQTFAFTEDIPSAYKVDETFLKRGQERFNIYCGACHGRDGMGNGPIAIRAKELQEVNGANGWVQPANLLEAPVRVRPDGHIFNTITNGIRSMPPYGGQVEVDDRWAIVAYVRALQLSHNAPGLLVPADQRQTLKVMSPAQTQPATLPSSPSVVPTVPGAH